MRAPALAALLLTIALAPACAPATDTAFVWVDAYKVERTAEPAATDAIRAGDDVDVRVLGQEQMSAKAKVRPDGFVTLPFVGDVEAGGKTAPGVRDEVERRLKQFVNAPVVTVSVEHGVPAPVSVFGEVARPGKFPIETKMTLLEALALAGGLTPFGHKDRIFVLRGQPDPTRIRFDLRKVMRGEGPGLAFYLEPGDVVVVE